METSLKNVGAVRYATRHPILAADETVIGYKLSFRTDVADHFGAHDADSASRTTIEMSTLLGLDVLCDHRLAFISCTRDILVGNGLAFLPSEQTVAEIDPAVAVDDVVLHACCELKNAGFRIALDRFTGFDPREPIAHLADYIKIDLAETRWEDIPCILGPERWRHTGLLATSVETRQDFEFARKAGFQFFQGYFFRKPETLCTRTLSANFTVYLRLLEAVAQTDLDWNAVEELIKSDPALYFRLLRFLNSAMVAYRGEVRTVRQALTILGENEIRRWCRLAGMFEMSQGRPDELLLSALVRARFAELLGSRVEHGSADLFLLGLLSMMDAILEIPMSVILEGLEINEDFARLLLDHDGGMKFIYELILAIEAGAWPLAVECCRAVRIEETFAAACYSDAMAWAQKLTASL